MNQQLQQQRLGSPESPPCSFPPIARSFPPTNSVMAENLTSPTQKPLPGGDQIPAPLQNPNAPSPPPDIFSPGLQNPQFAHIGGAPQQIQMDQQLQQQRLGSSPLQQQYGSAAAVNALRQHAEIYGGQINFGASQQQQQVGMAQVGGGQVPTQSVQSAAASQFTLQQQMLAQQGEGMVATHVPESTHTGSNETLDDADAKNGMEMKYQDKCFELEVMANKCEMLKKKCLEECNEKYESLMKKYTEECLEARKKCVDVCEPKYESLLKKYMDECLERKRLYNELVEIKGNIRVFCRCRPLAGEEVSRGGCSNVFYFDASQDTELQIISSDSSKKQFKFDHVFGPDASQEGVFAETLPIIRSVLDGFNACIFAYGQTGSGKTFTMEGTEENRGVNYRALEKLFELSEERKSSIRYEFFVSMLEVYNEKIRDLLVEPSQQGKKLEIKQAPEGTQDVPGLIEAQAYNTNEVWELLRTGKQNRSVGSTNANELSSRSHCLLRVTIKGENIVSGQKSRSNLWLVDLAGSERVGKIEVEGERLKESQFINKSLSALGDVISALATKNTHIPFRNSKLTHLLQSSLGGDCKTLMFVQISPSSADVGETLCSLNFATRVRGIEQGPARRQMDPAENIKYKQLVEKLRQEEKENTKLNDSLQLMHLKYASRENVFKTLHEKIKDLENQLAEERRNRHRQEAKTAPLSFYNRPPLPPISERIQSRKITTNASLAPWRRNVLTAIKPSIHGKENCPMNVRSLPDAAGKGPMKARRILVSSVERPATTAPKRRVSIASFPYHSQKSTQSSQQDNISSNVHVPFLRPQRRSSILSFSKLPLTPITATPDGQNSLTSFMGTDCNSSKFLSPQQHHRQQPMWKSKIPTFASPRRKLLLQSTPGSGQQKNPTPGKICFSIQKRIAIASPAQFPLQRREMQLAENQALQGKENLLKFGGARRVLVKNPRERRVSVA